MTTSPVAIIMGSQSDWPTMKCAADALDVGRARGDARDRFRHRDAEPDLRGGERIKQRVVDRRPEVHRGDL